jgi:hypothetical protein
MSGFINLIGKRFGKLIVIRRMNNNKSNKITWLCKCDCGNKKIICGGDLKNGRTQSCRCLLITHSLSDHNLYPIWNQMIQRCTNINDKYYNIYGGRGINVCKKWREFPSFLRDMGSGWKPGLTLERTNNKLGYFKDNCEWATQKQQQRNRRDNHLETYNTKTQCLAAWEEETGINQSTIRYRLKVGWSIEKALTTPVQKRRKKK